MMDKENMSRAEMLKKVQQADFLAYDLQLYLNTHPNCKKTLNMYVNAVKEAKKLREEFEKAYGPLMAGASSSLPPWQWINNPWTWEYERS